MSDETKIVSKASEEVPNALFAEQYPRCTEAEQELYKLYNARRKRELNVSTLWVTVRYRKLPRDMYLDNARSVAFRPSYRWAQWWAKCHTLSRRRRSNLKNKSV